MPPVFRPVSPAFLSTLRACTWESPERLTLPTEPPTSLRVCVGESGAWALGMAPREPRTMSRETFEELEGAGVIVGGGSYMVGERERALFDVDAGAALPGEIPSPPPPPPR